MKKKIYEKPEVSLVDYEIEESFADPSNSPNSGGSGSGEGNGGDEPVVVFTTPF